jgi:hypothetical protein
LGRCRAFDADERKYAALSAAINQRVGGGCTSWKDDYDEERGQWDGAMHRSVEAAIEVQGRVEASAYAQADVVI